jgi:hypothetical protein
MPPINCCSRLNKRGTRLPSEWVKMTEPALTDRIIAQGRVLFRAIEALSTIRPSGPLERTLARLLQTAGKCRLRAIVEAAPAWVSR